MKLLSASHRSGCADLGHGQVRAVLVGHGLDVAGLDVVEGDGLAPLLRVHGGGGHRVALALVHNLRVAPEASRKSVLYLGDFEYFDGQRP